MLVLTQGEFLQHIRKGLTSCERVSFAVAFVSKAGLDLIREPLIAALKGKTSVRILLDLSAGNTDPTAVWDLVQLADQHPSLEVGTLVPSDGHRLHCKLFLFSTGDEVLLVTGSANLTEPGLTANLEHGMAFTGLPTDEPIARSISFFEGIWASDRTKPVDPQVARLYEDFCGRQRLLQNRAQRRALGSWRLLENYLRSVPPPATISWPSPDAAYIVGVICSRGYFKDAECEISVRLRFNPGSYRGGNISVFDRSHQAAKVIPTIPAHIAERIQSILPAAARVSTKGMTVNMNFGQCPKIYHQLRQILGPGDSPASFELPSELSTAGDSVVVEFVRGFAVASALVTDATSLPGHPLVKATGTQTVWLRPQTGNKRLFMQLRDLIQDVLGLPVYTHWRQYREPHLKIRCQDFRQIGFGIGWWDDLVDAGARYNEQMLGQG